MKTLLVLMALLIPAGAWADTAYVRPYTRRDGTYVPGHYRTTPNDTKFDNWSTKGNTNPYTGEPGHQDPDSASHSKQLGASEEGSR